MLMMLMMAFAHAGDCKIYKGDYLLLLGTVKNDKFYKGDYASYSNLMGTRKNDKVYKGDYASYSNLLAH